VIYASESYAGALLEVLVHANLSSLPHHHKVVRISIPESVKIESVTANTLPGWNEESSEVARRFGNRWLQELRTAVLRVPSVITDGRESNSAFNPLHPQFSLLHASTPEKVCWDSRLFADRK
jgi:RES domain-containing protein